MARRFDKRDFGRLAESIKADLDKRKDRRKDLEKQWKEVDRQVEMKPTQRERRPGTDWMPEMELPLQAQALEVLTADARRLLFPQEKEWFRCHVKSTDEYLRAVESTLLISGDESATPVSPDQADLNALTQAILAHFHGQYDFRSAVDCLNVQAFKYGTYVGHVRWAKREVFSNDYRGTFRSREEIPVLVPGDIKNTYLDTSAQMVAREGMMIAPSVIRTYRQKLTDLKMAAKSRDTQTMSGGWMPGNISKLQTEDGHVHLMEYEGDCVIPRSGKDAFLPNCIVTLAMGSNLQVVRYRENPYPFRLFITGNYHLENMGPYGVSPLMKGVPIQMAASEAFSRTMQAQILETEPPVWCDPNDQYWKAQGGPRIEPRALWMSLTKPEPVSIGNAGALFNIYLGLLKQYEELTGVSSPRLGAQTKSHQTAFAIDQEMVRGQARTVDYVSCFTESLVTFLQMELTMLRRGMGETSVFIPQYAGYVDVNRTHVPEQAYIEVFGSSSPIAKREQEQKEFQALQMLLELDPQIREMGGRPLDLDAIRRDILRRANPALDLEAYLAEEQPQVEQPIPPGLPPGIAPAPPGIPGPPQIDPGLFLSA